MMKKCFTAIIVLIMSLCITACGTERIDTLTYAVYPYVPDAEYYQEIIETRWAELEPDIKLVRADWNCYHDEEPEGIDVIMYDAVMLEKIAANGWIQPIKTDEVQESDDIFPFALELARKTPYQLLADQFPIYSRLEELAENDKNHVILTP